MIESNHTEERLLRVESVLKRLRRESPEPLRIRMAAEVKVVIEVVTPFVNRPQPRPKH